MWSSFRAANLAANWELVRLRYENQPVSFGSKTLVGTAGVALAGLAKARHAARAPRMRVVRADIVSSLDVDVRITARERSFLRSLRYTARRGRLARPRRHPHGRRPHDPAWGARARAFTRRVERRRLAGTARARRAHADRPAQRRRAHGGPGTARDHGPAHPARRHRGPRVLGRVGERLAVRHAGVLRAAPGPVPGAQRGRAVGDRRCEARRRALPLHGRPRPHGDDHDARARTGGRRARGHRGRL